MIRVGILGATGYTALELIKLLLRHPEVELACLTSRQEGNPHVADVHPQLSGRVDMVLERLDPSAVADRVDCVFSCLPHAASASAIGPILGGTTKVVDFSADYRLGDAAVYQLWYGQEHPDQDRVGKVAYGLPELFRKQLAGADLVANPGCYPTAAILGLAPLFKAKLITSDDLIIDAKSGVSGAGRTAKLLTHYPECNESIMAYGVGQHRHTPEIAQILSAAAGSDISVLFTPHLTPMDRGILSTSYARLSAGVAEPQVMNALREFYEHEPFVRVVSHLPATKHVAGTNFCHVTAKVVGDRVIVLSCIDNLIKGASGAAVQNMNLMFGFDETTALV
jgi:N-acetyl-gamma-glutamyl-phosphate reductase